MAQKPIVAISMGDPAGVGPEVCLKAVRVERLLRRCVPLIVGDIQTLRLHAKKMHLPGKLTPVPAGEREKIVSVSKKGVPVIDMANVASRDRVFGKVRAALGRAAAGYIERGVALVCEDMADALVTGPIHKEALQKGGFRFPGHTEMLAHLLGNGRPVMMLAHGKIRIAHLSTHCSLREALGKVKRRRIVYVGKLLAETLEVLDGRPPRIAIAGLNPHAGENGLFGNEEMQEIAPAVRDLRAAGIETEGPEPPDTVFAKLRGGLFDGVVAMYHDQGHIAGKLMAFRFNAQGGGAVRGVNVTLGLSIVRTSVEHGTGFEIAGRGMADASSMVDAAILAARMVQKRT